MTPLQLIEKWKLNHPLIAEKMGMPYGTFSKKISPNQKAYHFTPEEEKKLLQVIKELHNDTKKVK